MHTFVERLQRIVPSDQFEQVLNSFKQPKSIGLRVNTLQCQDVTQLQAALPVTLTPGPLPNSFTADPTQRDLLTHHPLFSAGHFYIQNLSSMLPAHYLEAAPNQHNLDLCAAPGSKTSQLAAIMQNQGHIAAVERSHRRFHKLRDNLMRQGVTCVKTFCRDGKTVYKHCAEQFDRVLVDAPCSGEARFNLNEPETMQNWSEKAIKKLAREQWQLLYSGFMSLKPGGILIYSTCTLAPEENEGVITRLKKKLGKQAQLLPIALPIKNTQPCLIQWGETKFHPDVMHCRRILPNDSFESFFIAKITKAY
jgi:NOL1/NOP2/sun family putative RNA methylase